MKRRSFLSSSGALFYVPSALASAEGSESKQKRKKSLFLVPKCESIHTLNIFSDRLALGYGWKGKCQNPRLDIASVYIDQFPKKNDLGRDRINKYGLELYPSIEEALTLGGGDLAVDGVVIIA